MYKLLIVDDEPLVQVGIKSMLNWSEMNIEICGTAPNGEIASNIIDKENPDIVITDIKMPVMDGLKLLRECRERYGTDRPQFIMLTSYEDFHMAKEAITYQALDYLVKVELTPELLKETISKAVDKLNSLALPRFVAGGADGNGSAASLSLYSYTEKFLISLLNDLFESEEQMYLQAEKLHISMNSKGYICCYGSLDTGIPSSDNNRLLSIYQSSIQMIRELSEKYSHCYSIALDMTHFALLFCLDENIMKDSSDEITLKLVTMLTKLRLSLRNYYNVNIRCGVGNICLAPGSISESYQCARIAHGQANDDTPICQIGENARMPHSAFNISLFKSDLTKAFEEYDSELLANTLSTLSELISSHSHHYVQALDAVSNILYLSLSLLHDGKDVLNDIFKEYPDGYLSLYRQTTVAQIAGWLDYFTASICRLFDERRKDYKNRIVVDVKNYINEHIYEKLTLMEVAAQFAISSSYLSQLFGKYSDSGFTEYINSTKIQEAKRLLREEHKKVYEVAELLSFGSEFYFSKVFKKVEGITPTEFLNTVH